MGRSRKCLASRSSSSRTTARGGCRPACTSVVVERRHDHLKLVASIPDRERDARPSTSSGREHLACADHGFAYADDRGINDMAHRFFFLEPDSEIESRTCDAHRHYNSMRTSRIVGVRHGAPGSQEPSMRRFPTCGALVLRSARLGAMDEERSLIEQGIRRSGEQPPADVTGRTDRRCCVRRRSWSGPADRQNILLLFRGTDLSSPTLASVESHPSPIMTVVHLHVRDEATAGADGPARLISQSVHEQALHARLPTPREIALALARPPPRRTREGNQVMPTT